MTVHIQSWYCDVDSRGVVTYRLEIKHTMQSVY